MTVNYSRFFRYCLLICFCGLLSAANAATMEWTFHKTSDGSHPNGHEQQIMWLMNRARANPTREGVWLATSTDRQVAGSRDYFKVDVNMLKNEFAALYVKPPAAFDKRLYEAANVHSLDLIARDAQDHNNQFQRISDAGFKYWDARGSVFAYASSAINAHAAWNIDWGYGTGGMQDGRGHRKATMSTDGAYTNVGIAAIHETDRATRVGEYVTTGNYCYANEYAADHFNVFIVGTVWHDANGNDQYDPGEGIDNVRVTPDQGDYYAVTGDSGGYAVPVDPDTSLNYSVTFSGAGLPGNYVKSVIVAQESALLDIETSSDTATTRQNVPLPAIMMLLL